MSITKQKYIQFIDNSQFVSCPLMTDQVNEEGSQNHLLVHIVISSVQKIDLIKLKCIKQINRAIFARLRDNGYFGRQIVS